MAAIRVGLRPELLNRLDDIIVFNPLTGTTLRSVVRMLLQDVSKRLEGLDMQMTLPDAAIDHALAEAYDPELGTRPLRRYLEKHIVSAISRRIIAGDLTSGCIAEVDFHAGEWRVCVLPGTSAEHDDQLLRTESSST